MLIISSLIFVKMVDFEYNIYMGIIGRNFYNRNTLEVAKDLLGCKLCRFTENGIQEGVIVETEAYTHDDPACHAYSGKTPRSITLFKKSGLAYVYFIYGMYHCFNVTTEPEGIAGAVLIRALEPLNIKDTNGPAKLCRAMNITKELNEVDLTCKKSGLWIEEFKHFDNSEIITTTRIGIKQAADYPWRFYVKGNKFISKP